MATDSEGLLNILQELIEDDFGVFKMYMKRGMSADFEPIPWGKLERANRQETVALMKGQYDQGAGDVAEKILRKMGQNDLANELKLKLSKV